MELLLGFRAQLDFGLRGLGGVWARLGLVRDRAVNELVQAGLGDLCGFESEFFDFCDVVSVLAEFLDDLVALFFVLCGVFEAFESGEERLVLLLFALGLVFARFLRLCEFLEFCASFEFVFLLGPLQLLVALVLALFESFLELLVFLGLELDLLEALFFELLGLFVSLLVLLEDFLQFLLFLFLPLFLKLFEALFLLRGRHLPLRGRDDGDLGPG